MIPIQRSTHDATGIASALAAGIKQIMCHRNVARSIALNTHRRRGSSLHTSQQSATVSITCQLFAKALNAQAQRIRNIARQYLIQRAGRQARSVRAMHQTC